MAEAGGGAPMACNRRAGYRRSPSVEQTSASRFGPSRLRRGRARLPFPRIIMSTPMQDAVVRRSFLARLAAAGTAIAGVVAFPSRAAAQMPHSGPTHPADAWLDDLKG